MEDFSSVFLFFADFHEHLFEYRGETMRKTGKETFENVIRFWRLAKAEVVQPPKTELTENPFPFRSRYAILGLPNRKGNSLMLKKVNSSLTFFMWFCLWSNLGRLVWTYYDFRAHPNLYAMRSAPWYLSCVLYALITLVLLIPVVIAKLIIRRKLNNEQED